MTNLKMTDAGRDRERQEETVIDREIREVAERDRKGQGGTEREQ